MTSYTGTSHPLSVGDGMGDSYPLVNSQYTGFGVSPAHKTKRVVYAARLVGTPSAISTNSYTYKISTVNDDMIAESAFIIDPTGLSVDTTNYNTMVINDGTTTMFSGTTAYGITANELHEITKANTATNRTLEKGDSLYLVITGTVAGRIINPNTLVFVVCYQS